jgi:alkanesulfonate monooxygenase SsuD/methylene tetrahydromethanopterin reductase-like flavin-dependent oxidoreductase (luciferase family)
MQLMYFTEQPMSAYPAEEGLKFRATALMFSNKYFDPVAGSRLYNEYLEHYIYAEEKGIDGFMLNEHHNAPFCMQAKCNIFAAILAAVTKNAKIILLGNPLPLAENPVRLAEELAMIDMISKGRLVSGFVRGGGQEQLAAGVSPAFNRDRFEEAHDLVVAAWTREGPFRWEGTHYQHRVVNPWAVPLQKPHPRVWIPGVISPETIVWAARHGYPYIALNTPIDRTKRIWEIYDNVAAEAGFTPGPDYHGMLKQIHVAETEERRSRTPPNSGGCRASSPVSLIPCGARRRVTAAPKTVAPLSSSRAAGQKPPLSPGARKAARRFDDRRRYAKTGDRQAAHPARGDAARHSRHVGE